jgi:hypothetical protein
MTFYQHAKGQAVLKTRESTVVRGVSNGYTCLPRYSAVRIWERSCLELELEAICKSRNQQIKYKEILKGNETQVLKKLDTNFNRSGSRVVAGSAFVDLPLQRPLQQFSCWRLYLKTFEAVYPAIQTTPPVPSAVASKNVVLFSGSQSANFRDPPRTMLN